MEKYTTKKVDLYDFGEGLTLMNVLTKNGEGKLDRIDTYRCRGRRICTCWAYRKSGCTWSGFQLCRICSHDKIASEYLSPDVYR